MRYVVILVCGCVSLFFAGCSSQPTRDPSLLNCVNSYKRENPAMSADLAYSYCSAMQGVVERDK